MVAKEKVQEGFPPVCTAFFHFGVAIGGALVADHIGLIQYFLLPVADHFQCESMQLDQIVGKLLSRFTSIVNLVGPKLRLHEAFQEAFAHPGIKE